MVEILDITNRDKYLTKMMGLTWHDVSYLDGGWICKTCDVEEPEDSPYIVYHQNNDFSKWSGLGKLVDFCVKQSWWVDFLEKSNYHLDINYPNLFADKLYSYLQENNYVFVNELF